MKRDRRGGGRPRWVSDTRGAVAVTVALSLVPLTLAGVGAIDLQRGMSARSQLQDALDAAALAGAVAVFARAMPPTASDDERLAGVAGPVLDANLPPGPAFTVTRRAFWFDRTRSGLIIAQADAEVHTILGDLVLAGRPVAVRARSEVVRDSKNLEVALALDVTGSMRGAKLDALKGAAKDLVDLVVQDQQGLFYSKVSLVPYGAAVNLGAAVQDARGAAKANCETYGCASLSFLSKGGATLTFPASNCVTERTERALYTDAGYRFAPVGFHYADPANGCLAATVVPLSADKAMLKGQISALTAGGSTAGQIGLAWGWYTLAPNFAGLWPTADRRPAAYDPARLLKVVVLMTDGMFNTAYADGVISADSGPGSGDPATHSTKAATNGGSFAQARALCDGMKARGVLVYAVGFDLASQAPADAQASRDLMGYCASAPDQVYLPETGADLKSAFHQIGEQIASLRISE